MFVESKGTYTDLIATLEACFWHLGGLCGRVDDKRLLPRTRGCRVPSVHVGGGSLNFSTML